MPGDISDEPIEGACRAHQAALAGTDPETDEWGDLEPEAQDIFRDAMRAFARVRAPGPHVLRFDQSGSFSG
jgi:hypothetical protein